MVGGFLVSLWPEKPLNFQRWNFICICTNEQVYHYIRLAGIACIDEEEERFDEVSQAACEIPSAVEWIKMLFFNSYLSPSQEVLIMHSMNVCTFKYARMTALTIGWWSINAILFLVNKMHMSNISELKTTFLSLQDNGTYKYVLFSLIQYLKLWTIASKQFFQLFI